MNFRQAVLREHLQWYVTDPAQPCIALRCEKDDPVLSMYHQLVKAPGAFSCVPQQIHAIASPPQISEAQVYFSDVYDAKLEPVGETYCVYPYTLGFARLGTADEENLEEISKIISRPAHFHAFIRNWLETSDGRAAMIEDLSRDDYDGHSPEELKNHLKNIRYHMDDSDFDKVKEVYVHCSTNDETWEARADFMQKRIAELRDMTKPLQEDKIKRFYENYIDLSPEQEMERLAASVDDYKKTPWLFKNLITWT